MLKSKTAKMYSKVFIVTRFVKVLYKKFDYCFCFADETKILHKIEKIKKYPLN